MTQDGEQTPRRRRTQMHAEEYGKQKENNQLLSNHGAQENNQSNKQPAREATVLPFPNERMIQPLQQTAIPLMPQGQRTQETPRRASQMPEQGTRQANATMQGTQNPQAQSMWAQRPTNFVAGNTQRPHSQANPAGYAQQQGWHPTNEHQRTMQTGQYMQPQVPQQGNQTGWQRQPMPQNPYTYQQQRPSSGQVPQNGYQPMQNQPAYGWHPANQGTTPPSGGNGNVPPNHYGGFMPSGGGNGGGNHGDHQKRGKSAGMFHTLLKWLALVAGIALLGFLIHLVSDNIAASNAYNAMVAEVTSYDERYVPGVYVDGIDLGGMTREEAESAVTAQANQQRDSWKVRLMLEGLLVQEITNADLNMTVDVQEALDLAWKPGHEEESVEARKATMDALLEAPYEGYSATPSGDNSAIDNILLNISSKAYISAVDAQIVFDSSNFTNPLTIIPETYGRYMDITETKQQVYQMVSSLESGEITLQMQAIEPKVTKDMLESQIQLRATAYTPISTTSTTERTKNIEVASERINGTILQPGETFSFNGIVGNRTKENGFYEAIEYAYGAERMGYGGGVCQVSTTMYLASVKANLQIVKREPHSDAVGYTAYGKDATVNMDGRKIDFQFKNDTEHPIYIVTKVGNDRKYDKTHKVCVVSIYGESLGQGVTYDIVTETIEVLQPTDKVETIKDTKQTYVTYVDQTYTYREAKEGYKVASYRVKYVNGNEVERTALYTDTYKAKGMIVYVGTVERPADYYEQ